MGLSSISICLFVLQLLVKRVDIRLLKPPWWDELEEMVEAVEGARNRSQPTPVSRSGPVSYPNADMPQVPSNAIVYSQSSVPPVSATGAPYKAISITQGRGVAAAARYESQQQQPQQQPQQQQQQQSHVPLQFHQILPTLHVNEEHYRTAATSPMTAGQSAPGGGFDGQPTTLVANNHYQAHHLSQQQQQGGNELVAPGGPNTVLTAGSPDDLHSANRNFYDYDSDDELRRGEINFPMDGGE